MSKVRVSSQNWGEMKMAGKFFHLNLWLNLSWLFPPEIWARLSHRLRRQRPRHQLRPSPGIQPQRPRHQPRLSPGLRVSSHHHHHLTPIQTTHQRTELARLSNVCGQHVPHVKCSGRKELSVERGIQDHSGDFANEASLSLISRRRGMIGRKKF